MDKFVPSPNPATITITDIRDDLAGPGAKGRFGPYWGLRVLTEGARESIAWFLSTRELAAAQAARLHIGGCYVVRAEDTGEVSSRGSRITRLVITEAAAGAQVPFAGPGGGKATPSPASGEPAFRRLLLAQGEEPSVLAELWDRAYVVVRPSDSAPTDPYATATLTAALVAAWVALGCPPTPSEQSTPNGGA